MTFVPVMTTRTRLPTERVVMLDAIRTTKANRVNLPSVHIHSGMGDYSGWDWLDHVKWLSELSGLGQVELIMLAMKGYHFFTDEHVSEVWMVSKDYFRSTARLIYSEDDDGSDLRG
jgi:hypothetical protein